MHFQIGDHVVVAPPSRLAGRTGRVSYVVRSSGAIRYFIALDVVHQIGGRPCPEVTARADQLRLRP